MAKVTEVSQSFPEAPACVHPGLTLATPQAAQRKTLPCKRLAVSVDQSLLVATQGHT